MKKLKLISLMLVCLAAVSVTFTSCNDDDDNVRTLTPEERAAAFNQVRGTHSGYLYYNKVDASTSKTSLDSVAISWTIASDSVMTIKDFPISVIGKYVSDTAVSKAFSQLPPQDMKCYIGFTNVSPVAFLINPVTPQVQLTYGGATHKVLVPFYVNTAYSYGQINSQNKLRLQIIAGGIFADGTQTGWLTGAVPFVFLGK
ncbi:DUF4840 domain-containing protein [uncultured Prevotella sp.]|uniref:DUF4840 domain-containing protein n=1 Tax=uncultured Prevotella sp. TaxID=159272 RepID=UPI002591F3CC|nr:DUF4840 domain-containing protein [uncultured Prevotella sp.]